MVGPNLLDSKGLSNVEKKKNRVKASKKTLAALAQMGDQKGKDKKDVKKKVRSGADVRKAMYGSKE